MTKVCDVPMPMPPRFVVNSGLSECMFLCCPVCGCDYIHPEQVAVDQVGTRSVVARESTMVTTSDRPDNRRGSVVALKFWCEQGHGFEYRYTFHKGQLICELSSWRLPVGQPPSELWRS